MYIENIVVGNPTLEPSRMFAVDNTDWENIEKPKTFFTEERSLPKILKEIGVVPSIGEVRRNKPNLCITFEEPTYFECKWGKRKLFILVGE